MDFELPINAKMDVTLPMRELYIFAAALTLAGLLLILVNKIKI
jgi:hypothetical protein